MKKNLSIIKINLLQNINNQKSSNLNLYFGKGRLNKKLGKYVKRDWYEVQLTIPKKISGKTVYPKGKFTVYTLDGYKINMITSGDYHKNFSSEKDLKIFGKWIKGKLEKSKSLKKGKLITEKVLQNYGNNNLILIKISNKNYIMHF